MPELPEVETIRRGLVRLIEGKRILTVKIYEERVIEGASPEDIEAWISGAKIRACLRRGKYLILRGDGFCMLIHLGMSGRLIFFPQGGDPQKHTHLCLCFADGSELHFNDPRRFGRIKLHRLSPLSQIPELRSLGWDPLHEPIPLPLLRDALGRRKAPIKQVLMDQKLIAGIGNIYASEILFCSSIDPLRAACSLRPPEVKKLAWAIREVLHKAIQCGGTSISSFRDAEGRKGTHQDHLKVYGRAGEGCLHCHAAIIGRPMSGRSTYYCPRCQQ